MKQSAVKTLGVAALGAAFAATAAGAASAAPLPDTGALDSVTHTLPVDQVTGQLPGASDALSQDHGAVGTVGRAAPRALGSLGQANPLGGLLGGLPVNGLGSLPVDGIPLGG